MLFKFRKVDSPRYLYCNEEETPPHLFHSCLNTKQLWNKLRQYLSQFINIPNSNPESSIVEICDNNQHSNAHKSSITINQRARKGIKWF